MAVAVRAARRPQRGDGPAAVRAGRGRRGAGVLSPGAAPARDARRARGRPAAGRERLLPGVLADHPVPEPGASTGDARPLVRRPLEPRRERRLADPGRRARRDGGAGPLRRPLLPAADRAGRALAGWLARHRRLRPRSRPGFGGRRSAPRSWHSSSCRTWTATCSGWRRAGSATASAPGSRTTTSRRSSPRRRSTSAPRSRSWSRR